ncbi:MAG: hypothetical protein ACW99G_21710 [Candidatus Thorarchaeota archaeon]|jgi:hypothetical protein
MPKDSKYYTYQQASLSQKVSFKIPIIQKLAGSDTEISDGIGLFEMLHKHKVIDLRKGNLPLFMDLLDVQRLSHFATSEKTNEISKLGFMLPKQDEDEDWSEDESG